jgi:hypothetical protein
MQQHGRSAIVRPRARTGTISKILLLVLVGLPLVVVGPSAIGPGHVMAAGGKPVGTGSASSATSTHYAYLPAMRSALSSPRPIIVRFTANPALIEEGGSTTLSWQVFNSVDILALEPGVGDVTGQNQVVVWPSESTVYTLTATNQLGSISAQVSVTVAPPPPEITSFVASPDTLKQGEYTTLSWTTVGKIDSLVLEPGIGDVTGQTMLTIAPTETTTYTLTATNVSGSDSSETLVRVSPMTELLVFDWDGPVTKADSGFPGGDPTGAANGNWTHAPNFAEGTYHFRLEIRSQPVPKVMQVQYCVWQKYPGEVEQREACGERAALTGDPGAKVTWSDAIADMWEKTEPIDYSLERNRHGAVIRNKYGDPVSAKVGWDWNGENPDEWYPLDWRFTVVVVGEGATFSGWHNYLDP